MAKKKKNKNNQAFVGKVTGITDKQAQKLDAGFKKLKKKIAPKGKGTSITGPQNKVLAGPKKKKELK